MTRGEGPVGADGFRPAQVTGDGSTAGRRRRTGGRSGAVGLHGPEAAASASESENAVIIRLATETGSFEATLNDGAARDLVVLLPLTLETEDFRQTGRIACPPRELDTTGAPDASDPKAGDLARYTPWAAWSSSTATAGTPRAWPSSATSPIAGMPGDSPPPTASRWRTCSVPGITGRDGRAGVRSRPGPALVRPLPGGHVARRFGGGGP
ncbi:cyclophilin-like fold protein [Streptomyces roseolus]|uniref:cyclophilin-like fold protein n=1 Tax=Streptomyces roseolus TaxID=67358 RepID=UPI0019C160AD|nr:cyclophilin-like fold protein [Streptomyces roseolus]GGR40995.1 hypothetical protein GCM10010282_37120 [Streptomyces roseolus]